MSPYDDFYKARKLIVDILKKDLIGPVTENEVLYELPTRYYATAMLPPESGGGFQAELADTDEGSEGKAAEEDRDFISFGNIASTSATGLTFAIFADCAAISVSIEYAFYLPEMNKLQDKDTKDLHVQTAWKRVKLSFTQTIFPVKSGTKANSRHYDLEGGIRLYSVVRPETDDGAQIITLALRNMNAAKGNSEEDAAHCAFQVSIRAQTIDKKTGFAPINRTIPLGIDEEIAQMDMLYAHARTWAQGHGCAAEWDRENDPPLWVGTTFLPLCDIPQMKSPSAGLDAILKIRTLAEADREKIIPGLQRIADAYEEWINQLESQIPGGRHEACARRSISRCRQACARIKEGIECLNKDALVFRAFKLANRAMLIQRERDVLKNGQTVSEPAWRLFQLGFFLHEVSSFAVPQIPERSEVDLLWFPTGGGKTEAYLGIAAFAIFLRRLRYPKASGVTVIMRYTLRLLTLQQFERAAILILACDYIRATELPETPEIAIGFWAGEKMTPNTLDDARRNLELLQSGGVASPSPCLLKKCPWCGEPLGPADYSVDTHHAPRMRIRCHNVGCEFFTKDMPIHLIDECLYSHLPAFVVATIDKFAQVPLQERAGRILGAHTGKRPPELIIQDELHLITGPLGTMTGIYEAAFQRICQQDGIPPKIIASTATIRNAAGQILSLYGREHTQFPPAGISMKDSFFAVEASPAEMPARLYAGVMGEGRVTSVNMMTRVEAALLFATRHLAADGYADEVVDNFWTLTCYFNSLRELGGASVRIIDDVRDRFAYLAGEKFAQIYPGVDPNKKYEHNLELTSRKESIDLPAEIERLDRAWRKHDHADVYDFVLASNMISVGVDVGRLGLMTIVGQPKTSAEYIQASSRVGRRNPGLVITIYNSQRSRDRSHYEQFMSFHSALYRHVEAASLTPFADRARDRGLQALFVALCRCLDKNLAGDEDAANFVLSNKKVTDIISYILAYVAKVDGAETKATEQELQEIAHEWTNRICGGALRYRHRNDAKVWLIMEDMARDRFRMMNSLRSVEPQSSIYIQGEQK